MLLFVTALFGLAILYSASTQRHGMVIRQTISFTIAFVVMIVNERKSCPVFTVILPVFLCGWRGITDTGQIIGECDWVQRWIGILVW